jgi:hypothetical protein
MGNGEGKLLRKKSRLLTQQVFDSHEVERFLRNSIRKCALTNDKSIWSRKGKTHVLYLIDGVRLHLLR